MITLNVELGARSYPIFIGQGILGQIDLYRPYIRGKQVMVVTNETIAPLYLQQVLDCLADFQYDHVILPDGEEYKHLGTLCTIFDELLEKQIARREIFVVALLHQLRHFEGKQADNEIGQVKQPIQQNGLRLRGHGKHQTRDPDQQTAAH